MKTKIPWTTELRPRPTQRQRGFTLIELLISLTILTIVTLGLASVIISSLRINQQNRDITIASNLAQHQLETYLSDFSQVPVGEITLAPKDIDATLANQPVNTRMVLVVAPGDTALNPIRVEIRAYTVDPPGSANKKIMLFQIATLISKQKRFGHDTDE